MFNNFSLSTSKLKTVVKFNVTGCFFVIICEIY